MAREFRRVARSLRKGQITWSHAAVIHRRAVVQEVKRQQAIPKGVNSETTREYADQARYPQRGS